jgi:transposase
MPTPYPKEFRRDVVAVARRGEQSRAQVARSFGISESCLARWLSIADREDSDHSPASARADEVQLREVLKRNKQLEQENEILRRATAYFARDALPLRSSGRLNIGSGGVGSAPRHD